MTSIELTDIHVQAHHGMLEGEEKTGNPYVINLSVQFEEGSSNFDDIRNTIDYVSLYEIIRQRMMVPTPLLEKICEGIIRRIKHQYPFTRAVNLSIQKLQPPIRQFQGKVGVRMHKTFND